MASLWNRTGFSFSRLKIARLSAAKARVSRRIARDERTVWQRFVRVCTAIAAFWKELAAVVLSVVSVCAVAVILVLLWQARTKTTLAIAPISVPKTVAESGYTPDVAAQRLRDALNKVVEDAHSRKIGPEVALQADLPSIVVPTIGLSLETIAADIRTFFHIPGRWNISGEFTNAQKQLWLRLRMNGRDFFTSPNGVDPERPDELLAPAAKNVFELVDPYIAAASLFDRDPDKCLEKARRIIADRREKDPIVRWAHNLVGGVLRKQHKYKVALDEYQKAIELDSGDATFHYNLGNVLNDQHETDEAIAEYQKAIELDPRFGWPHDGLGTALRAQGKTDEAIAEYKKAIELDPRDATTHYSLGVALSDQHKTEEAIAEYKKAIELDPRDALPHNYLGNALSDQGQTAEAIAEYRKAIELDPRYELPHNNLGNALSDPAEAIAEYRKAIELDPRYALPHNNLGEALREQHKTGEAIAEYRKAIALDPRYALPHNNLGVALHAQHKDEEAVAECRKAIELDPRDADSHKNLAIILRAQGKTDEVDAEERKAKELGAKHPDCNLRDSAPSSWSAGWV
jgi:tetratricopeptide (TPR) repeat protein